MNGCGLVLDGNGAVGNSKREAQMRLATEDQPLIQPSEVTVNVLPVHTAQPVITPIGKYLQSFITAFTLYNSSIVLPVVIF